MSLLISSKSFPKELSQQVINTPGTTKTTLEHIPIDVFQHFFLDLETARAMGLTSKYFYTQIFSNNFPWRSLLMRLFPNFCSEVPTHMKNLDFYQYFTQIGTNIRDGKYQDVRLAGHPGLVNAMIVEGDLLISGSEDGTIKIWHTKTGKLLRTMDHKKAVTALAIRERSDGGKMIISGSKGCAVKFWNMANGASLGGFEQNLVSSLHKTAALWMHNHKLFAACDNGTTEICEFTRPLNTRIFASFEDPVTSMCVAKDNLFVAVGKERYDWSRCLRYGKVAAFDLLEKRPDQLFTLEDELFTSLSVYENRVFGATKDKEIYIWDLDTGLRCGKMPLPPGQEVVSMLTHSDQLIIALQNYCEGGSEIKIWNLPITNLLVGKAIPPYRTLAITGLIHNLSICRGDKLVSTSWGTDISQKLNKLGDPDTAKKTIHIWDIKSGKLLWSYKENQECKDEIFYSTLVNQDKIISALPDGSIRILNFSSQ